MGASGPAKPKGFDDARLLRLWVAMAFLYAATGSVNPLLSVYMSSRGLSGVEIGALTSLAALISLAATLFLSYLSDLVEGREALQALLCFGSALAAAAYTVAADFAHFALVHPTYVALSYSTMSLSAAVAMDRIGESKRGASFGVMRTSGAAGWIGGTLAGGLLAQHVGFHAAFAFSTVLLAASALLYSPGPPRLTARRSEVRPCPAALARRASVLAVALATLTASVANPAYYTFLPLYMVRELRTSELLASIAFSVTPLAEIPAMVLLGSLSDRVGRRRVMALCLAAYPVRFALTGLLRDPALVIATQLLHGLTFGGLYVVATAHLAEEMAGAAGVASSVYPIAANLGSVLGGYLLALVLAGSDFRSMYLTAAALSSLALPLLFAPEIFGKLLKGRLT